MMFVFGKDEILNHSGNKNGEHGGRPPSSQIVDPRRFISQVRSDRGKELLPNELKKYVHPGVVVETKINITKINYVPIWHVNGSAKANADKCELYAPFEVLIHLLAKRFIPFKSKILQLTAVDMQLAAASNETVDQYANFRKYQLREACKQKDDEISKLNATINEMNSKLDIMRVDLTSANTKLDKANADLDTANNKLDDLVQSHRDIKTAMISFTTNLVNYTEKNIPTNAITTGTTQETLVVLYRPSLDRDLREPISEYFEKSKNGDDALVLTANHVILDTLVVRTLDVEKELTAHNYDESTDTIVFNSKCNNAMDLFKHFSDHVSCAIEINIKNVCARKLICLRDKLPDLVKSLKMFASRSLNVKRGWLEMLQLNTTAIMNKIDEQTGEEKTEILALKEALDRNTNAVNSVLAELRRRHPTATQVYYNHGYRDLIIRDEEVLCKVLKESRRLHKLTHDEITKLRFRKQ